MSASSNAQPGEPSSGDTGFEAMWSSDGMTRTFSSATAGLPADLPFLFQDGQRFGPYLSRAGAARGPRSSWRS